MNHASGRGRYISCCDKEFNPYFDLRIRYAKTLEIRGIRNYGLAFLESKNMTEKELKAALKKYDDVQQ
jgi:hypothetical protein